MLNVKQTLKNLHKKFPTLGLDELFEVLDCYVEEYSFNGIETKPRMWYQTTTTSAGEPELLKVYDGGANTVAISKDPYQLTTSH